MMCPNQNNFSNRMNVIGLHKYILSPCTFTPYFSSRVESCHNIISKLLLTSLKSPSLSSCIPQFFVFPFNDDEKIIRGDLSLQTHNLFSNYTQSHTLTHTHTQNYQAFVLTYAQFLYKILKKVT